MAKITLNQILSELQPTYKPQVQALRQRQSLIPGQIAQEEEALGAKQTQAFDDITSGARRKGLGFSGIPLSEQAKYTSTEFLPALARLKQSGREQALSLEEAILGVKERRDTTAQSLLQQTRDRRENRRQFNANLALQREQMAAQERQAAASRAASSGGGWVPTQNAPSGGGKSGSGQKGQVVQNGSDFQFYGNSGKAITAAQYAAKNNMDIRDVLYKMGSAGDQTAADLYNKIGKPQGQGPGTSIPFSFWQKKYPWILGGV